MSFGGQRCHGPPSAFHLILPLNRLPLMGHNSKVVFRNHFGSSTDIDIGIEVETDIDIETDKYLCGAGGGKSNLNGSRGRITSA